MSKDPVAIDAAPARLLNENQRPSRLPSLDKMNLWLQSASAINLGKPRERGLEHFRGGRRTEPLVELQQLAPQQPKIRGF